MAAVDDIYNQITRNSRKRTGRSFFPAANGQGQTLFATSPYGQTSTVLPPEQNPAYQAAIARNPTTASMRAGGSGAGAYSWITTPSGGSMRVPTGSLGALLNTGSLRGSQVTQIGNQAPIDLAASYRKGYGAPAPTIQNFAGGPALVQGGVANPVANLTPQQRVQYGVGNTLDYFRTNPALNVAASALGGLGRNIASWFGGGNTPNIIPSANAGQPSPSPTPIQTPVPSPTASPTPSPTAAGTPIPFGQTTWGDIGIGARNFGNYLGNQVQQARRYSDYY